MPGGGGGPPPKWAIAHPWPFGLIFGILVFGAFILMSAVHGEFSPKAVAIGVGGGILAFLLASLIAASYHGDVSQGS